MSQIAQPRHPEVKVQLLGITDPYVILQRVRLALKLQGLPMHEVDKFTDDIIATQNTLQVAKDWVTIIS